MRAATQMGAVMLVLSATAVGCPLQVRELPGCRLSSATCDDANPCTEDTCDEDTGLCLFESVPSGTDCGDGDACNGLERCDNGARCSIGAPLTVNDDDPCTKDACDPATGLVSHKPLAGCGLSFWLPLSENGAPSPRIRHSALWTGTEMLIWGGRPAPGQVTDTGARYDPSTDTWAAMTTAGAPAPRHSHSAAWTGNEMIVWGGFGESDYETTGALYHPATDTWRKMSDIGAPSGRTFQSTVWTDTEMIVWGGFNGTTVLSDGARYALGNNTWTTLPVGAPQRRFSHNAVWTGSRMIVWGGTDTDGWLATGGVYDRTLDSWTSATTLTDVPASREGSSAAWVGDDMLIWGGWDGGNYSNRGALYNLDEDTWQAINGAAPKARVDHAWVWTGDKLVVWGGCSGQGCTTLHDTGGHYDTDDDSWVHIGSDPGLSGRSLATAIWTNFEVIIWGGEDTSGPRGDGARATIQ